MLAGWIAQVASLALGQALSRDRAVEPWLARALCERVRDGLREGLRLLASIPGNAVPEKLIPARERLNLTRLEAEQQAAVRVADEQLAAARSSNADVFPTPRPREG
jgi:hypothetical protein